MAEKDKIDHRINCRCNESVEEWYVNAPEYFNCFFTYMRFNNRSHTLQEIANLLNMSISAVTSIEKKAIEKLRQNQEI